MGVDDYIAKPFEQGELMARVDAVIRLSANKKVERTTISSLGVVLDFNRRQASVDGESVELNLTEWDVLKTLVSEPDVVI